MVIDWSVLDKLDDVDSDELSGFIVARDLCRASFDQDCAILNSCEPLFFRAIENGEQAEWVSHLATQFMLWRENYPPTLPAILAITCKNLEIDTSHELFPIALTACILGEVYNGNAFHNVDHFREVLTIVLRFCVTHNQITFDEDNKFDTADILLLIIAAVLHDFKHDGTNNGVGDDHIPSRLEQQAFDKSRPFLESMGIADDYLSIIKSLIIATDASGHENPATIVRQIANYQNNKTPVSVNLGYENFTNNPKLTTMALILCEADIVPSSSLSYEFSKLMTRNLSNEENTITPTATTLNGFMIHVCKDNLISKSARYLLGENFKYIRQVSEKDAKNKVEY